MLRNGTVPLARAWYSWSSRAAEMVFLPLGVRLTPVAYAGSTGRATLFGPEAAPRLGAHALDAANVHLDLAHAGTRIALDYAKADPFTLHGAWSAEALGEWGLRFWFNLCLSAEDGSAVTADASGTLLVRVGHRCVALASAEPPVLITGHASVEALAAHYETHGYFHLGARAETAPVLALRFNFEMARQNRFVLAVADDADLARAQARAALSVPLPRPAPPRGVGGGGGDAGAAGALAAIRDVVAWNHVWDEVNGRAYTSISRNWNLAKFGGFGVWLNDQLYAALLTSLFDADVARDNLVTALAGATPQGNIACLLTANDAWVDRTQLPIGGFLLWLIQARSGGGGRTLLRLAYDTLARNHAWWWRMRDPKGLGLCSYGTSAVGSGLYKGTAFGARNESSMDNSPMHDEAPYDPECRTLAGIDVGLNALLALDAEMLALVAAEIGEPAAAAAHRAKAEATRAAIRDRLWDESRGIFANRLWSGDFVRSVTPTSFYPLLCDAATPEQRQRLLVALEDPALFGGPIGLPAVARDDPAYRDNRYWRGRVWPPLNFLVWHGLRRAGAHAVARRLAAKSAALFEAVWRERRLCPENYNADTGEPLDQPDTEGFYTWGALMPALAVFERMDVDPWAGWSILAEGGEESLGPIETPIGTLRLERRDGVTRLSKGGVAILVTNLCGRLTEVGFGPNHFEVRLPPIDAPRSFLALPHVPSARLVHVALDGVAVESRDVAGGAGVEDLPLCAESRRLIMIWTPLD